MSQQEYLNRLLSERPKIIATNKVRDQSEQVFIVQARASSIPTQVVTATEIRDDYATNTENTAPLKTAYKASVGNGTQGDYTSILQRAQYGAIKGSRYDTSVAPIVVLPSSVTDHAAAPWAQNTVVSCRVPDNRYFFPSKLSVTCSTNQIRYPYPSG